MIHPDKAFLWFVRAMMPPMLIGIIATVIQVWNDSPTLGLFPKLITTYVMVVALVAIICGWVITEESLGKEKK